MSVKVTEDGKIVINLDVTLTPIQVFRLIKELESALFESHKKTGKSIDEGFAR